MEKKTELYDVIIVGGGAAGLTAGIYCGRAKLKTLLLEESLVGGLATYTNEIENYPGFPEGTTGIDLMNLFQKQAKKFGVKFKLTNVQSVDLSNDLKIVETFRVQYQAKVVIIASGGKPRLTGAKREAEFLYDKGISFCATCDAAANTGKTVLVVGSGDAAIEEGMFLTKFADKVIVSVMHDEGVMDCNEIAKTQALSNPKMSFVWNTVVDSFEGDDHLDTVVLKNVKTNDLISITVDSCFLFIGYIPNTEIFKGQVALSRSGNVFTDEKMATDVNGVFACGDVRDKFLKQVATAVGDGAIAGYSAEKYMAECEVFEEQILNHNMPSVVFIYDASNATERELLPVIEQAESLLLNVARLTRVDTYKSDGIAKKLNVDSTPAIVYLNEGEIKSVLSDEITVENVVALVK